MITPAELARIQEWDEVLDDSSYYEILGLLPLADPSAVREAFREFALAFHPDMHQDSSHEDRTRVARIFQRGAEAYRVLADPELRMQYDLGLSRGEVRLAPGRVPRRASVAPGRAKPLPELCRTAGGKTSAKKAARLIDEGDLLGAKSELERALGFEGGVNLELRERLDAIELALFAMGGD